MAITFIYPVSVTGQNSINYDTETKEAKIDKNKNDSQDSLNYVMRDKKGNTYELSKEYLDKMKAYVSIDGNGKVTFKTLSSFINCSEKNTYAEWERIRDLKNPANGRKGNLQYCIVQNFGEDLDPALANEIGVKFAKEYLSQYQCVVSTHINTGHVHNHIEFNATSFIDGKKYNRCTDETRAIRKLSDRLCDEYGLEVLEATREMKVVKTQTLDGKIIFYEPTDRKNEIREGEYANKNDYRNTSQYASIKENEKDHFEILKADIDRLLPHATSYEDLLKQLENVGYEIKAKTKNDEWRKHISFKLDGWEKFTRDSHLGEEYTREYLAKKIEENLNVFRDGERQASAGAEKKVQVVEEKLYNINVDDVRDEDIYVYGRIVIEEIDEEYRYRKKKEADNKNNYEKINRSKIEKIIIRDTKNLNKEVNSIVKQAMRPERIQHPRLALEDKRKQYLIDRINANLKTLNFVERKDLKSFEQINSIVRSLCEKRNACYEKVKLISQALKKANKDLVTIQKYNSLKQTIERNEGNAEYVLFELENDKALLKTYESILKDKNLLKESQQLKFKENLEKYTRSFAQITQALEKINRDIQEYDDCILNISHIDRNSGNVYEAQIKNYYEEKKAVTKEKTEETQERE